MKSEISFRRTETFPLGAKIEITDILFEEDLDELKALIEKFSAQYKKDRAEIMLSCEKAIGKQAE